MDFAEPGHSTATSGHFQFSSVQDSMFAFGKAHMRSIPSLKSFPNVSFETVPLPVVRLKMALSRPLKEGRLAVMRASKSNYVKRLCLVLPLVSRP